MNKKLRDKILFYCGNHDIRFRLCIGKHSLYYRCPKYEMEYRDDREIICMNRLSLYHAEKIYEAAEKLYFSRKLKEGSVLSQGKVTAKVISIQPDIIKVVITRGGKANAMCENTVY